MKHWSYTGDSRDELNKANEVARLKATERRTSYWNFKEEKLQFRMSLKHIYKSTEILPFPPPLQDPLPHSPLPLREGMTLKK